MGVPEPPKHGLVIANRNGVQKQAFVESHFQEEVNWGPQPESGIELFTPFSLSGVSPIYAFFFKS